MDKGTLVQIKHEAAIITLLTEIIKEETFSIDEKSIKIEKEICNKNIETIKQKLSQIYITYFQIKKENLLMNISTLEKQFLDLNHELLSKESSLSLLTTKEESIKLLIKELPNWNPVYTKCSELEKWEMLGRVIEKIIIKKDSFEIITKDYISIPSIINHKIKH